MKTVVFNPVALDDLDEITNYIASDNPMAAEEVREAVLDTAESLGAHPDLGIRPRFSARRFAGIRFLPTSRYPNYLVFYRELSNAVEILRVLHGARNLPRLFE
ncbi:MAG: type II toxin-antitoxin system RelE/ParE family toxin [Verrucomicrobiaceae bacterium]|jgi:toxin ParE1/3/4|nr:type II toxin-antitoxin system RelE/ParE family toxin [Verrucomicrobiaceae bacterium]